MITVSISYNFTIGELMDCLYDCDELCRVVDYQGLYDELDDYLNLYYGGAIPSLEEVNDFLRYDYDEVLKGIGAEMTDNGEWDYGQAEEEEELDKAMDKCRDCNF